MSLILAGYVFDGPKNLKDYQKTDIRGLFGIFFLKKPEKKVDDYGVLYIGMTEEIDTAQNFPVSHDKYSCWLEKAGNAPENLYIGLCPTPGLLPKQMESIKRFLVYKYNTTCNK